MARLIRVSDRIFDLEAIAVAEYFQVQEDSSVPTLRIGLIGGQEFKLYSAEAEKIWQLLKQSALNVGMPSGEN